MKSGKANLLSFLIAEYQYGIQLPVVLEIFRVPAMAPLPRAPAIIEGVVNIRGKVVPVLNIRKRFRLPAKPPHPADHLIVAKAGPRTVALRVDRVLDIEEVEPKDIENATAVTPRAEYLAGIAKFPNGLVLIHDLDTFLADSEARNFDQALEESKAPP